MRIRGSVLLPIAGFSVFALVLISTLVLALAGLLPLHQGRFSIWLLVICFGLACYNTSTAWLAQRITYPLFAYVDESKFLGYHSSYEDRIPLPVILPVLLLMNLSGVLVWFPPREMPEWVVLSGLLIQVITALSTILLQVPAHKELSVGFQTKAHSRLVKTNWIRTIGLTAHTVILFWALVHPQFR